MRIAFIIIVICLFFLKKQYLTLEKGNSNAIKGMLALLIVLQHSLLEYKDGTCLPWFQDMGAWICGMFFFISAYGLYCQELNIREMIISDFVRKRILKILFPFLIITAGYQIVIAIFNDYSFPALISSLKSGDTNLLLPYSWFVITLLFLYISTYFSIRKNHGVVFMFLLITVYIVIMRNIFHWGPWWYTSVYGYWLGMAVQKTKIKMDALKKFRISAIVSLSLILLLLYGHPKSLLNIITPRMRFNNPLRNM